MVLKVEIITAIDRNEALSIVRKALASSGGWIIDHALFSNLTATISFELPLGKTRKLVAALENAGLSTKVEGGLPKTGEGDTRGAIHLTFLHDERDLKRDVPAFG
jgi:hypothetical protein